VANGREAKTKQMEADAASWRRNLAPMSGSSRDGMPLSENRSASADLNPWLARLVSAKATNTADIVIAIPNLCRSRAPAILCQPVLA